MIFDASLVTEVDQVPPEFLALVDVVIERGRQVAGIEGKATATPRPRDARHLAYLRDRLGDRFTLGVVLHTGHQRVVLGDRLVAAPISTLWG